MSTEQDKIKHSKRLLKDDNAIKKQLKIAKSAGIEKYIKENATGTADKEVELEEEEECLEE